MNFGKSVIKLSFTSKNTKISATKWGEDDFHCEINKVDGLDITQVAQVDLRCRCRGNWSFPESTFLVPIKTCSAEVIFSPFGPF